MFHINAGALVKLALLTLSVSQAATAMATPPRRAVQPEAAALLENMNGDADAHSVTTVYTVVLTTVTATPEPGVLPTPVSEVQPWKPTSSSLQSTPSLVTPALSSVTPPATTSAPSSTSSLSFINTASAHCDFTACMGSILWCWTWGEPHYTTGPFGPGANYGPKPYATCSNKATSSTLSTATVRPTA